MSTAIKVILGKLPKNFSDFSIAKSPPPPSPCCLLTQARDWHFEDVLDNSFQVFSKRRPQNCLICIYLNKEIEYVVYGHALLYSIFEIWTHICTYIYSLDIMLFIEVQKLYFHVPRQKIFNYKYVLMYWITIKKNSWNYKSRFFPQMNTIVV